MLVRPILARILLYMSGSSFTDLETSKPSQCKCGTDGSLKPGFASKSANVSFASYSQELENQTTPRTGSPLPSSTCKNKMLIKSEGIAEVPIPHLGEAGRPVIESSMGHTEAYATALETARWVW